MEVPNLLAFSNLNTSMKIHQLFELVHLIERSVGENDKFEIHLLDTLCQWLEVCKDDPDEELRKLYVLKAKISDQMSSKHFVGLMVPFERLFNRNVVDSDIIVHTGDAGIGGVRKTWPFVIILDNIRSAMNVGSVFRSAECLGAKEIILCGYTATPDNAKVRKAAMGTSTLVPHRWFSSAREAIEVVRSEGMTVCAVETCEGATKLQDLQLASEGIAILFGNERHGLDPAIISQVDDIVSIPMQGAKNSLNVAVTTGIISHWLTTKLTAIEG